jgi:hypothetical protein
LAGEVGFEGGLLQQLLRKTSLVFVAADRLHEGKYRVWGSIE